jgi:hypothetical protein
MCSLVDLNWHYDYLQAVVLKEDLPEAEDKTQPQYGTIEKVRSFVLGCQVPENGQLRLRKQRAGPHIRRFRELLAENPNCSVKPLAASKASSSTAKGKRAKESEEDIDIDYWVKLFNQGSEKKVSFHIPRHP